MKQLLPEDVSKLIRKARKFLDSAERLIESGDFDSAVSRVYYAMFYGAEALLLTRGKAYSRHQGVISAFGRYFVRTGIFSVEMQRWLADAFEDRNLADYAVGTGIDKKRAEERLQRGRIFIQRIVDYLNDPSCRSLG